MRGKPIRLSPVRRFICDLLEAGASVPTVPVQRRMDLRALLAARAALSPRPPWLALFTKAYAKVATVTPELRRAYVKFPWAQLYEYPVSIAAIAFEREYGGEQGVLIGRIREPEHMPLTELARAIRHFQEVPVEDCKEFRRALRLSRLPRLVRRSLWWVGLNVGRQRGNYFGTFGV